MPRKTFVAGDPLLASEMNLLAQDGYVLNASLDTTTGELGGVWTTWTPTLTQSGTVTATVTRARYMRIGKTIHFYASLAVTGTGTASNAVTVSLPVTAAASGFMVPGGGHIGDVSAALNYPGLTWLQSTTTAVLFNAVTTSATLLYPLGQSSFTAALASGDVVTIGGTYEAA